MLQGRGYEAIKCSALGSFGSVLAAICALFPARLLMGSPVYAYEKLWPFIPFILLIIVTILMLNERGELPDLKGTKPPKLRKLKITLKKSGDEESEYEELETLTETTKHPGESVKIKGRVTRIASSHQMFIGDETGKMLMVQ